MPLLRRHPVATLFALVVVLAASVVGVTAAAVWKAAHDDEARRIDHVQAIAVLGAAEYDTRPSPVFEGRLEHAVELYQRHFGSLVITLGGKQPGDVTTEADAARTWLTQHGVPSADVHAVPVGNDTLESLRAAAAYLRTRRVRTVFLVSDPWHNLRIRRMGRDLGMTAYVSATWHSAARSQWTRLSGYVRETFAYLYYRVLGR